MKKNIFYALLVVLISLSSCDNNDEDNIKYLDNTLIEGIWHYELKTEYDQRTIDSTVFCFENNKAYSLFYAKISGLDTLKFETKTEYGRYLLTDSIIIFPDSPYEGGSKFGYQLKKGNIDSLFLSDKSLSPYWEGYTRLNK